MSLIDLFSAEQTTAQPLTQEAFMRTVEQAMKPPGSHSHIIASSAKPGSLVLCHSCGRPVRVPEVWP